MSAPLRSMAEWDAYRGRMRDLIQIDPSETVALTIDMQKEFLDPEVGGALVDPEATARVVASTARFLDACRERGVPVVHAYVKRRHAEAERGFYGSAYSRASKAAGLSQNLISAAQQTADRVEGTPTWEVPDVLLRDGDVHMDAKRAMDSFHATDLETLLTRVFHARTLLITGVNTDSCVHATTFGAAHRGYEPVVITDCVASMRGSDNHDMALELMSRTIAWTMDSDTVIAKLDEASGSAAR